MDNKTRSLLSKISEFQENTILIDWENLYIKKNKDCFEIVTDIVAQMDEKQKSITELYKYRSSVVDILWAWGSHFSWRIWSQDGFSGIYGDEFSTRDTLISIGIKEKWKAITDWLWKWWFIEGHPEILHILEERERIDAKRKLKRLDEFIYKLGE